MIYFPKELFWPGMKWDKADKYEEELEQNE